MGNLDHFGVSTDLPKTLILVDKNGVKIKYFQEVFLNQILAEKRALLKEISELKKK